MAGGPQRIEWISVRNLVDSLPLMVVVVLTATLTTNLILSRLDEQARRLEYIERELHDLRERVARIEAHPSVSAPMFGR